MKLTMKSLLTLFAFLFLFGCAAKQMNTLPSFEAKQFDASMYNAKVDNFLMVFDASSSMYEKHNGMKKFDIARAVLLRMNDTVPELGQTAGLRSFGHHPKVSKQPTMLVYGMEKYMTHNLENNFEKSITKPGGYSPLYKALDAANEDLKGLSGDMNAIIVISDGELPGDVLSSAKALKETYGSSLCIYTIQIGDSPQGEETLRQIADTGGCGFYSTADQVLTSAGMAAFVEKVFLDGKPAAPAPAPAPAPERKDSDGDGVYDDEDQCPDTPKGAKVNSLGCWVLDHVLFDFDKDVIKPEAYPLLNEVAEILNNNPISVELQGHCDNVGTEEYNMDLSLRRAHAVKNYLINKGILHNRMATTGFGFTKPVALNGTEAGRAMNRRVELHPY